MLNDICIGNIVIDCNDAFALRDFYTGLLGGESETISGFPVLKSTNGLLLLFNRTDFDYIKPVWPEKPNQQQKQMHFDFHVNDLPLAVRKAETLGARKADMQYDESHYVTMLDPEGHPFCLCRKISDSSC